MTLETSIEATALGGGEVRLMSNDLRHLESSAGGQLLLPGDRGWQEAVGVWNAMITKTPALVVRPGTAREVAAAIDFARRHHVLTSVKCGGHNIAGTAIADHGLMLDMSAMREVRVDRIAQLAHVGGGSLLADVDSATQQHGLATTLGFVSRTGVAGLTLGGGFGYLMRRFGWAADNVEEVEIVTADGAIRVASRDRDPDLFWAIRGGGGNFGVVTRFTFRVHAVGPLVTGGLMIWSAERAEEVLDAYHALTNTAPRELTAAVMIRLAPPAPFVPPAAHFKPVVAILVCYSGAHPEHDLAPLRALPPPLIDLVAERPYVSQQSMLDDLDPPGRCQYWKTEFLPGLSRDFLDVWREAALEVASPMSYSVIFHIEGAHNERAMDDGAVGNRDARFVSGFSGVWRPDEDGHDADDRTAAAYGKNLARLEEVKAVYDPENLFRSNRNISPRQ